MMRSSGDEADVAGPVSLSRSPDKQLPAQATLHNEFVVATPASTDSDGSSVQHCNKLSNHSKGLILCLLGVLVLSPDTLLIRLIDDSHSDDDEAGSGSSATSNTTGTNVTRPVTSDDDELSTFTLLFWRFLTFDVGIVVMTVVVYVWHYGRLPTSTVVTTSLNKIWHVAPLKLVAFTILNSSLGQVCFTFSVINTKVANTLVVIATSPMFAAGYSWLLLREVPPVRTLVAMAVSVTAIVLVFAGDLGGDGTVGDVLAAVTANSMGLNFVMLRLLSQRAPSVSLVEPVLLLNGLLIVVVSAAAGADPGSPSGMEWLWLWLQGSTVLAVAFFALSHGPRFLPAPEVSLLLLLETVTGPVWVWLALGEEPPELTLVGGLLLLGTLCVHSVFALRDERRKESHADKQDQQDRLDAVEHSDPEFQKSTDV
eukprot:m.154873 g.154873  ORF g.154873 m.154873 type:complete len:425 (-) comp17512_c0_seq2:149-1423(-)